MSETDLLQTFRENRSEDAFTQLVRRYAGLVYSVAKRRLANNALAEDVTQIVFIRLAKTPPDVRDVAQLSAWLHRTTVHVTIDIWRAESRRRQREQQAVIMEPADTALWEEIAPQLDEALNQMDDDDRQALLLRFFGGLSMREVGAGLGVSEDAAKMRVSRAVERLRTRLGAGTACTAALLTALLTERFVEAVPSSLIGRLTTLRLSSVAGTIIGGGLTGTLKGISGFQWVTGLLVLTVAGVGGAKLFRAVEAPNHPQEAEIMAADPNHTATANKGQDAFSTQAMVASAAPTARPLKMSFQVLDAVTGHGIPGARVWAAYFGAGGNGEGQDMLTDDSGIASIPEPVDATKNHGMNVFVVAEGHVPIAMSFPNSDTPAIYSARLARAATAGGLVVDENGSPVAGVQIKLENCGRAWGQQVSEDFQKCPVTSRDDGSWSFGYMPAHSTNELRFILSRDDYGQTELMVPVEEANVTNLTLVIERGYKISGRITDQQNQPVAHAQLQTLSGDRDKQRSTESDSDGNFTLAGVPPDDLVGSKWVYPSNTSETNAAGSVILRAPHPFYGHEVMFQETNNGIVSRTWRDVPWPEAPPPPQMELTIQADGLAPLRTTVQLTNTTNIINFTLASGQVFRGRVVDEAGHPIRHAIVQTDWDNQNIRAFDWQTRTDGNGNFAWNSAPTGTVLYWIEADGYNVIRGSAMVADGTRHEIVLKREGVR